MSELHAFRSAFVLQLLSFTVACVHPYVSSDVSFWSSIAALYWFITNHPMIIFVIIWGEGGWLLFFFFGNYNIAVKLKGTLKQGNNKPRDMQHCFSEIFLSGVGLSLDNLSR